MPSYYSGAGVLTHHKAPECIDFTDNDITHLGGFPLFTQLTNLMCARNRISTIQPDLAKNIPNLFNLVLTENNITEFADLDPMAGFPKLQHLAILDNPVTRKEVRYHPWKPFSKTLFEWTDIPPSEFPILCHPPQPQYPLSKPRQGQRRRAFPSQRAVRYCRQPD